VYAKQECSQTAEQRKEVLEVSSNAHKETETKQTASTAQSYRWSSVHLRSSRRGRASKIRTYQAKTEKTLGSILEISVGLLGLMLNVRFQVRKEPQVRLFCFVSIYIMPAARSVLNAPFF
jgi:hypothetical protein